MINFAHHFHLKFQNFQYINENWYEENSLIVIISAHYLHRSALPGKIKMPEKSHINIINAYSKYVQKTFIYSSKIRF